jgi:hypothetical protein
MADENEMTVNTEAADASASATAAEPKKQRAPRRAKNAAGASVSETSSATATPAKTTRRKRGEKAAEAAAAAVDAGSVKKRGGRPAKPQTVKQVVSAPTAEAPVLDEMADLIQLEEENKRLRVALAEKLRAENAHLRKRLGVD